MLDKNLYVDINVLQSVPSSNINRDDIGAPKTAIYGGVTRARVSSQSWKKAVRTAFIEDEQDADWISGLRTLRAPETLANELQKIDNSISSEDAMKKATSVFDAAKIKLEEKDEKKKNQTRLY